MVTSREMDRLEQSYTGRGEAAFYVSGAGHEASAALALHLIPDDWLCCHYRDKALMLARGMGPEEMFRSLFAKDRSSSRGRQMHGLLSYAPAKIVSLATPVGNNALHAVGIAESLRAKGVCRKIGSGKGEPEDSSGSNQLAPFVLCSMGDGTTQEGEVMEAIAHAVRESLPVLFLIQDNSLAISTRTRGKTFFSLPWGNADSFYGIPIRRFDGRNPNEAYQVFGEEVAYIRNKQSPRILVMEVERIGSHSNADDQRVYRSLEELEAIQQRGDPIQNLRKLLIDQGMSSESLTELEESVRRSLEETAERVRREEDPRPVFTAVKPYEGRLLQADAEYRGKPHTGGEEGITLLEALKGVLASHLSRDSRVVLFGEDIEDPKGDVFGVTRGLSTAFPDRVKNSPLAESTIVGVSIGRALSGDRPVAFFQFSDFMPVAYNQIFSELACMYWRTDGSWQAPVILMVTCGGYRPGLGPFHASTMEALAAHTPGLDVFMPSTAADAAGLLNAAFESGRPTVFFYPKTVLNDREHTVVGEPSELFVPPGKARILRSGDRITLVGWGNTVGLCIQASDALEEAGVQAEVIDLRSIVPWDRETIISSASKTKKLVIVHEDNHTAGMGAEIAATVAEALRGKVEVRRVTRPDTWVPFHFGNQLEVLPSFKKILEVSVEMLGGTVKWEKSGETEKGTFLVEAIGSSPADESVTVLTWKVKEGDQVQSGQPIAEMEADKAVLELNAPVDGTVLKVLVPEGEMVKVGTPLLKLQLLHKESGEQGDSGLKEHPFKEPSGKPIITWKKTILSTIPSGEENLLKESGIRKEVPVGIAGIAGTVGGRQVSNEEISRFCPSWTPEDIIKRTGIASRPWVAEGESALTLAMDACRKLQSRTRIPPDKIDLILCATGTPLYNTPSMAALIQYELGKENGEYLAQAYDINAACSGYLYALQVAYDFLQSEPDARILLVTTEVLSPKTNLQDPGTAPIFGDAATATLLVGGENAASLRIRVHRPVLAAKGEPGESLRVPADPADRIFMEGQKVFLEAVRGMKRMLDRACERAGLHPSDLDLIIPHQANQRIINAVRQKYRVPEEKVFSNIRNMGNTSSSTIPLCLEKVLEPVLMGGGTDAAKSPGRTAPYRIGLTAFGGGFTFGGGILEVW